MWKCTKSVTVYHATCLLQCSLRKNANISTTVKSLHMAGFVKLEAEIENCENQIA